MDSSEEATFPQHYTAQGKVYSHTIFVLELINTFVEILIATGFDKLQLCKHSLFIKRSIIIPGK